MKRVGHVYEQVSDWDNLVEAERVSVKGKAKNIGVQRHKANRMRYMTEIQHAIESHTIRTGEYKHEQRVSGQDKIRDIAKLHFHPNHIYHQSLKMAAYWRVDKALIRHTYACRKGYGQTAAALRIRDFLRQHRGEGLWFGQGDVVKYYSSIRHAFLRQQLLRLFKDEAFVDAYMEPFGKFNPEGVGVPLGIPPSQLAGNICLMGLDRLAMDELKCMGYTRYLDDFVFFGHTKYEVKQKMKRLEEYLNSIGFEMHVPKIHRVSEGLDMLGFVYYGTRNDMYWRKADKRRWLRRRAKVTNPKRLRELDDAAWGMMRWGNSHCKRLFKKRTGREVVSTTKGGDKIMGVSFNKSGIERSARTDAYGNPFIDAPKTSMGVVLDNEIVVNDVVHNVRTSHGDGRYALGIEAFGKRWKLIVNAAPIKAFCDDMEVHRVTKFKTVFVDRGGKKYDVDTERTEILEMNHRAVEETAEGRIVYSDTKEAVEV